MRAGGWCLWHVHEPRQSHVAPINDLREHDLKPECWCKPTPDVEFPHLWVHNSLDQRELVEQGRRAVQ